MATTYLMPMNRVEGDLEIKVAIEDGLVSDAWVIGTMYRGLETMLAGRGALDGLVITPRVCGICSTSHLLAAAQALENLADICPAENGRLIRQIALGAEILQNDIRHLFLMFAADLASSAYSGRRHHEEAVRRYQPYKGSAVVAAILATRSIPEIIAILGGQWPHSSFIVPGGITSQPNDADLRQCRMLLNAFRRWYEDRVLGAPLEEMAAIVNFQQFLGWIENDERRRHSELGFFLRCGESFGLDRIGRAHDSFLAAARSSRNGSPPETGTDGSGFFYQGVFGSFDQGKISEQITSAHYHEGLAGGHPFDEETRPCCEENPAAYSWCKAPRYGGHPAETGALAEALVGADPLISDMTTTWGATALVRELARLLRPVRLIRDMERWIGAVRSNEPFYHSSGIPTSGAGVGLVAAPRGVLGHWVKLSGGTIEQYQIISPTTWNGSPRDDKGIRGPIEEALVGTPVRNPDNPVEVGHVVRSFDLCMVCSVHAISRRGASLGTVRLAV